MIAHKKTSLKRLALRLFFALFGGVLAALALEVFLIPNKIMDGGITGISIILSHLSLIHLGIFLFLLNLPFFFLGYKQIGKTFAFTTLFGITVLSVSTYLMQRIPSFTNDMLLVTFFGGLLLGAGVGIVIRYGGALDGTEILSIVLTRRLPFSVGEIVMFINVFVFGIGGFVFGWANAMYSILAYVIATKTMDAVIQGLDESKSVWIISDQYKEIGDTILARLGRGVTYMKGRGAYTGDDKAIVFCVISRLEESKLKDILADIDPHAFMAVSDMSEVRGGNFKKRNIH